MLGCTHFLHLEEEFREVLQGEGITVVDSLEGVARQVARLAGTGPALGGKSGGKESTGMGGKRPPKAGRRAFFTSQGMNLLNPGSERSLRGSTFRGGDPAMRGEVLYGMHRSTP